MGRKPDLRLLMVLPLLAVTAWAQYVMTADQAIEFIKSSLKLHHDSDAQIANAVKKIKLKQKLEERRVEELQGLGAGPKTIAALRDLSAGSEGLPDAPAPVAVAPKPVIPPPNPEELSRILHDMIDNARNYTKSLPDYMCIQVTRRHIDPTGKEDWRSYDRIQEQVSYVDHKEHYEVSMINGQAVKNVEHQRLGGSTLSGDFGTIFGEIFAEETATEFEWDHWATLRGKRMYVFSFHVPQSRSQFTIYDGETRRTVTAGYRGLIYADRDSNMVMRYKFECEDLPASFPVKAVGLDVNYDFIDIADHKYVLPLKTEVKSTAQTARGKFMTWNEAEFHMYKKFGTESSITFDSTDLPPDTTQEQPPIPDAKDQKKPPPPPTKKQP
jgi:hypothetical protein